MTLEEMEIAVGQLLDGKLPPERHEALKEFLRTHPGAMERYLDCIDLHNALKSNVAHQRPLGNPLPDLIETVVQRQRSRVLKISLMVGAAAAVLLLSVSVMVRLKTLQPASLSLELSGDAEANVWHTSTDSPPKGTMVAGSSMKLTSGTALLRFNSGVVSVVEAPVEMTLKGDGSLALFRGKAWFEIPEEAEGFRVVTPQLEAIDLGTEFAIETSREIDDRIFVFKGHVRAKALFGQGDSSNLTTASARAVDADGELVEIEIDTSTFYRALPDFAGHLDLKLHDLQHGIGTSTSPPLDRDDYHDVADDRWGLNSESDQAINATSGEVWVSRHDLGEDPPPLVTTISGLRPGIACEISLLRPHHRTLNRGEILAAIEGRPIVACSSKNSSPVFGRSLGHFQEYRCSLGVVEADAEGKIRVHLAHTGGKRSRSYVSSIGVRIIPGQSSPIHDLME